MADSSNPLSIRANEDTKELFKKLVDSSGVENQGEFLNRLLALYQVETAKSNTSSGVLKPALEAIEALTSRLYDIVRGAGETITANEEKRDQELADKLALKDSLIATLQQQIEALKHDRIEDEERAALLISEREMAESKAAELQQQIRQLKDATSDKDDLIAKYKEKTDSLGDIVAEYKDAAGKSGELDKAVRNLTQANAGLQRQIDELTREHQRQLDASKVEQDNLRNSLLLQKDRELLELRQQFQGDAEERHAKYIADLNGYQSMVKDLLEREKAGSDQPAKTPPKPRAPRGGSTKKEATTATETNAATED